VKLEPVNVPEAVIVQLRTVATITGVTDAQGPASPVAKLFPLIVTEIPARPEEGFRVIAGPTTVKVA